MTDSSALRITFDGKSYAIEDFELGELEWLEDELGCSLDEVNPNSMKAAVRFVTVIKRRENPEFSLDDARKLTLRVFDNDDAAQAAAEADKTNGGTKRPTKRAKPKGSGARASG